MAKSAANPAAIRGRDREFKILFISGYASAFEASLQENTQFVFLPKPFTLGQLVTAVKRLCQHGALPAACRAARAAFQSGSGKMSSG